MSPGKPVGAIKVLVPRHNTQPVSSELDAAIQVLPEVQNIRIDTASAGSDPSSTALSQAIENASEWNSLLATARAERGPQWDIGSQMFQVDYGSDLYYDPTILLETQKEARQQLEEQRQPQPQPQHPHFAPSQQMHPQMPPQMMPQMMPQMQPHMPPQMQPQMPPPAQMQFPPPQGLDPRYLADQSRGYSSPTRHQQVPQYPNVVGGSPFGHGQMQSPHFYAEANARVASHMPMQHPDAMMNMNMNMGMNPMAVGRRMTRGMMGSEDGYPGMQ